MAKSIYLILFITTLTLVLFITTEERVNSCVNTLKKLSFILLFLAFIYIIMFKQYNIYYIILLIYKLIIIVILFKLFFLNMSFGNMHQGIYGVLKPLKRINVDLEKFSFDITLSIHFIKFFLQSRQMIKEIQNINGKRNYNIKNMVLPQIIYTINELENLQCNLKIKLYKLDYKKINLVSKIIFVLIFMMFIICLFKEVM